MTTVLIILLAYPVVTTALNLIGGLLTACVAHEEKKFFQVLWVTGPTVSLATSLIWIRAFGALAYFVYAKIFATFAAVFRADRKSVV